MKGNRKDSLKVEAVPTWLRRPARGSFAALLHLTAREGERWEMRSLGVIKARRFALLRGRAGSPPAGSGAPAPVTAGERGQRGWERCRTPSATGHGPPEQRTLARRGRCHFPRCVRGSPPFSLAGLGEPTPAWDSQRLLSVPRVGAWAGCPHPQEPSSPVWSWKRHSDHPPLPRHLLCPCRGDLGEGRMLQEPPSTDQGSVWPPNTAPPKQQGDQGTLGGPFPKTPPLPLSGAAQEPLGPR